MDVSKVLIEYDNMFGTAPLEEIERFLSMKIDMAYQERDNYASVTLLNEMIGLCRETGNKNLGIDACNKAVLLMKRLGLEDSLEYGITLLNVANAYRGFGFLDDSLTIYKEVETIFNRMLEPGDFNYASLYNNWSLLYQEMQEFHNSRLMLERALAIVDRNDKAVMEQAATRTNLANTLLELCKENLKKTGNINDSMCQAYYEQSLNYLRQAIDIYEADGGRDYHYSAALTTMGDLLSFSGSLEEAAGYYESAMNQHVAHVGKNDAYEIIKSKYDDVVKQIMAARAGSNATVEEDKEIVADSLPESSDNEEKLIEAMWNDQTEEVPGQEIDTKEVTRIETDAEPFTLDGNPFNMNIREEKLISNKNIFRNHMERCKSFYEEYGRKMIHDKFPDYENRIAVGLVGEGSECLGFDDDISKDHDYEVGFCMWLNDSDYAAIGLNLHKEYGNLVLTHGKKYFDNYAGNRAEINENISFRHGVLSIREFYTNILQTSDSVVEKLCNTTEGDALTETEWDSLEEEMIATATNGVVFRDDLGTFSNARKNLLRYYPDKVWLVRLSRELHWFSQNAQYNYGRMMGRRDVVTARVCVANAMESAMKIIYLLNRSYSPYYKWRYRGIQKFLNFGKAAHIIEEIATTKSQTSEWRDGYNPYVVNRSDKIICLFEELAEIILAALVNMNLVEGTDTFLDIYSKQLLAKSQENQAILTYSFDELVDMIVAEEWQQFDKVKNEGGRADCQDDWNTFSIMRKSQYMSWAYELLLSYYNDLVTARSNGWNLITEKYARMMKSTNPDKYAELEKDLPKRDEERRAIEEQIISIQVEWMEDFAAKYPKMAGNARSIHTSEDSEYNTSYETYLRGELGTYSEETVVMYGRFIVSLKKEGKNLAYMIMENTAKLYGYASVEDAEFHLQ